MPVTKKRPLVVLTDYSYETIQPFIDVYKAADFEFRPCQCKSPSVLAPQAARPKTMTRDRMRARIFFISVPP